MKIKELKLLWGYTIAKNDPFAKLKAKVSRIQWAIGFTNEQQILKHKGDFVFFLTKVFGFPDTEILPVVDRMIRDCKNEPTLEEIKLKSLVVCRYAQEYKMTLPVAYFTIKNNDLWLVLMK